jgi:hypothetical protein
MNIKIKYIDGTEEKEYCDEFPRVKDGLLIIPKGRYSPSVYINLQVIKSFQEEERQ